MELRTYLYKLPAVAVLALCLTPIVRHTDLGENVVREKEYRSAILGLARRFDDADCPGVVFQSRYVVYSENDGKTDSYLFELVLV